MSAFTPSLSFVSHATPVVYHRFELGEDRLQLAIDAGRDLTGEVLVHPHGIGACNPNVGRLFKYAWRAIHSEVWDYASDNEVVRYAEKSPGKCAKLTSKRRKIRGNVPVDLDVIKGVAMLEPGRQLVESSKALIIPIGERLATKVSMSAKGSIYPDLEWDTGVYYLLEPEVSLTPVEKPILFISVVLEPL